MSCLVQLGGEHGCWASADTRLQALIPSAGHSCSPAGQPTCCRRQRLRQPCAGLPTPGQAGHVQHIAHGTCHTGPVLYAGNPTCTVVKRQQWAVAYTALCSASCSSASLARAAVQACMPWALAGSGMGMLRVVGSGCCASACGHVPRRQGRRGGSGLMSRGCTVDVCPADTIQQALRRLVSRLSSRRAARRLAAWAAARVAQACMPQRLDEHDEHAGSSLERCARVHASDPARHALRAHSPEAAWSSAHACMPLTLPDIQSGHTPLMLWTRRGGTEPSALQPGGKGGAGGGSHSTQAAAEMGAALLPRLWSRAELAQHTLRAWATRCCAARAGWYHILCC